MGEALEVKCLRSWWNEKNIWKETSIETAMKYGAPIKDNGQKNTHQTTLHVYLGYRKHV